MSGKKVKNSMRDDVLFLILKTAVFLIILAIIFLFIFGIYRCSGNMMSPAFKDGDLAIYYRLQKNYQPSDTIIIEKNGEAQLRRIIAKVGDHVEITADGLKVNGYLQQETDIYTETLPYTDGITFPLTVCKDEYFVLGDNRTNAKDSRIYGTVKKSEIKGKVITLLRHRGL